MIPIEEMTEVELLSPETMAELFDQEDRLLRADMIAKMTVRAKQLKCKTTFEGLVKEYQKVEREELKKERASVAIIENLTNFSDCPYDQMACGSWIATDEKVYKQNPLGFNDILACYHPIMPVERTRNLETGEEQIKLAYKRSGKWESITVPKTQVASASQIVSLAGKGIAVTSETAKFLVQYLADVENLNDDFINLKYSTSKLGWNKAGFLPYDTEIEFDGGSRFDQIFHSIGMHGDRDAWFNHVLELRKSGRAEIKIMMAASFASVLIDKIGALPFFVDLWGETEGGKTVTLMVAASIWADPDESRYIGDFKTTDVALEARADMLNNLPVILDDTSKTSRRIAENFEGVVYDLCSGKGKSRSNKELGMNRENRWKNCFLTSGERPLDSYVNQGGAMNRILEVECQEKVYADPQYTAELIKDNYGYAGKEFVQIASEIGDEKLKQMQREIQKELADDTKTQKQSISLSIILLADRIATDYLFKDGEYIPMKEAKKMLVDLSEISDGERAYQYILDEVARNEIKFDSDTKCEKWGIIEDGYAIIYNSVFTEICKRGGFSPTAFEHWADRHALIKISFDKRGKLYTKTKKIGGQSIRCVWVKIDDGNDVSFD